LNGFAAESLAKRIHRPVELAQLCFARLEQAKLAASLADKVRDPHADEPARDET
jgi:hypothetical protein